MFGYVKPDNPHMYVKDVVLYKASYCGLCKSIGLKCGQKARFVLSYDLSFLSCFLHNIMNEDLVIEKQHCVLHTIKKRPIAKPTKLSKRIGVLNVILAYEKMNDDVLDSNKSKFKRSIFKSSYKKALKSEPDLCKIVKNGYDALYKYEKSEGDSVIVASEFFGKLLCDVVKYISGEYYSDHVENLCFNLGKWIYIADALDDFDKDYKKKEYNPFILAYKDVKSKDELLKKYLNDVQFMFGDIASEISYSNDNVKYYFNHDLIDNILNKGIITTTKKLLEVK